MHSPQGADLCVCVCESASACVWVGVFLQQPKLHQVRNHLTQSQTGNVKCELGTFWQLYIQSPGVCSKVVRGHAEACAAS